GFALHGPAQALGAPIQAFFPQATDRPDHGDLSLIRVVGATPEGRAMALTFSRMENRAVRQALTRLVEVLVQAAYKAVMKLLVIDTALGACTAAVFADGGPLAVRFEPMAKGHQERLGGLARDVVADAGGGFESLD
ncbi:hypothetical protein K4A07_17585, partial [Lactiplantibacillus plantarum]|nr:hypothetical protein [Lactiplantibacillus plantarum]